MPAELSKRPEPSRQRTGSARQRPESSQWKERARVTGSRRGREGARPPGGFAGALRRTPVALWRDDATDRAAALTYYAVLALFPALLVTVCCIGLTGADAGGRLADQVSALVPAQSRLLVRSVLEEMADQRSAAWLLASLGAVGALWSASSYLGRLPPGPAHHARHRGPPATVAYRAAHRTDRLRTAGPARGQCVHSRADGRGGDRAGPGARHGQRCQPGVERAEVAAAAGPRRRPGARGVPDGAARHPEAAPRRCPAGYSPSALWLLVSAGFALYTAHAGTYNRLYGSLAGTIVFLVWLWLTNLSLLAGAQFNAELVRGRGRSDRARPGRRHLGSSDRPARPEPAQTRLHVRRFSS